MMYRDCTRYIVVCVISQDEFFQIAEKSSDYKDVIPNARLNEIISLQKRSCQILERVVLLSLRHFKTS